MKKDRIQLVKILRNYIEKIEPCFYIEDHKVYLKDTNGKKIIKLETELGSGFNASAYTMRGIGLGRILKMSCKILSKRSFGYSHIF